MEREQGNMEKWCNYLQWSYIAKAVLIVYKDNKIGGEGISPQSDLWIANSVLRQSIYKRTIKEWCILTSLEWTDFPYSEDGVIKIYMRYRKRSASELEGYANELIIAVALAQQ